MFCGRANIQKLIVVDGDALTRIHLKQMLVEDGFNVAEAGNGIEAISLIQNFQPDMVFVNITMPDKSGLEILKEIKVTNPQAQVAIIVGEGQQALAMEALKAGAVDFVTKPFDQEEILGTIKKALG